MGAAMSRALLLSPDDQAVTAITGVLEEMAVSCERPLDGVSAAQKLNSHNFDLVLVDCENLPAAKLIFDVCRRGKAGQTPVPIAIVDGRAGLPTAFRLGAELILTKPVSMDHARSTIRTAVGRVRKEEPAQATPALNSISTTVPDAPKEQAAAAAAATTAPALVSALPEMAETAPANIASEAVAPAASPFPTLQTSTAVKEAAVPASTPALQPESDFAFAPVIKRPMESLPALEPEEKPSEDPALAVADDVEADEVVSPAPVLSSLNPVRANSPRRKQNRGPVVLLFFILAGGGFYAAWMYQPAFREMVRPQVERVLALVGKTTPPSAHPQAKASVPAPNEATPTPAATTPSVTPENQAPASNASTAPASEETATAVPDAGTSAPSLTTGRATNSATPVKKAPASAVAGSDESAESRVESGKPARTIALENPPEMDKNVVILSSKGAEKRLLSKVPPVYPKEAKAAGAEGTVVLKILISDSGKVANVALVEGNPMLADSAIHAVKQWRYRPYVRDGKELAFQTIVMLNFQRP